MMDNMDKAINKGSDSTIYTTATNGKPQLSDSLENNLKYINLNFIDDSESSSQTKDAEDSKITSPARTKKPPPCKILPSTLPFHGQNELPKPKQETGLKSKTVIEMGFTPNEIDDWEKMVQPPKKNLYKLLKNMIDNYVKPNIQIHIGGFIFNCHMMVLQCYSDFFMEAKNEVAMELPEKEITPRAFVMAYEWMLAEEPLVQREGILELFNAANFLRIEDLISQCWLCLDDDLCFREDSAFLLYLEARTYGLESLEQLMLTRICKFFLTLVATQEFLELTAKEMCALMSSNTIGVNSEIEIFMSVVRWLSHNWDERKSDMLDVIKCVRFSLMPPWFLVTLNKNTDCVEIDRVVSHSEVKNFMNDGISYTTTLLYNVENGDEFQNFLERHKMTAPTQRQWLFDKECSFHHRLECSNMQYVSYKTFLGYLQMIQGAGKNYWRTLEMARGIEKSLQCCIHPDCCKTTTSLFSKKGSRTRDVEVQTNVRQRKTVVNNSRADICDHETLDQPELDYNMTRIGNDAVGPTKPSKPCPNSFRLATLTQTKGGIHGGGIGDGNPDAKKPEMLEGLHGNNIVSVAAKPNEPDVQVYGHHAITSLQSEEFNLITNQKILIFGGIDPYCQHCRHVEKRGKQLLATGSGVGIKVECNNGRAGGGSTESLTNYGDQVLFYDASSMQWKHLSYIPFGSRHHHAAVVCNGFVYVIGGTRTALGCTKKSIFEKSVWSLNTKSLKWTLESSLPESRRDFAVIAIEGEENNKHAPGFFVIGGEGVTGAALDTVWFYNVLTKKWTKKASLNVGRYGLAAAMVNNEIWIAGGLIDDRTTRTCCGGGSIVGEHRAADVITDSMEYYSLKCTDEICNDNAAVAAAGGDGAGGFASCVDDGRGCKGSQWIKSKLHLRVPRLFGKFCKISTSNELYLVGGIGFNSDNVLTSFSSVDRFSFEEAKWHHYGDINWARHGHDIAAFNERIIIIGGVSTIEKRTLTKVEAFCTETRQSLTDIPELPWPVSGSAVVIVE